MGAKHVVVYAEGVGETAGSISSARAPGSAIPEDALGAAHLLVRRALAPARNLPESAIVFDEPLRTRGRIPRGSDLHDARTLAQLLTWASPSRRPELAIVMIDSDGDVRRKEKLAEAVQSVSTTHVIAMAVQEFEAWLIADHNAVARVLGSGPSYPGPSQDLRPGEAKRALQDWAAAAGRDGAGTRRTLANVCELSEVAKICSSFAELQRELAALSL